MTFCQNFYHKLIVRSEITLLELRDDFGELYSFFSHSCLYVVTFQLFQKYV